MRETPQLTVSPDGTWRVIDAYNGVSCLASGTWYLTPRGKYKVREHGRGLYNVNHYPDPKWMWCRVVLLILAEYDS